MNRCDFIKISIALFLGVIVALSGNAFDYAPGLATLIAHRGESYDAPENTLPAYKTAVDRGFGFECDVYLSRDKRLFTFHDGNLTRTTAGANTNRCTEVDWETTVSKLNVGGWGKWKGSRFDPTPPALLSEVLDLARNGRWIYIEVKGGYPSWVPYIKAELARSKKANSGNVLFISFSDKVCAELKRQMPAYRVYWLTGCTKKTADGGSVVLEPSEIVAKLRQIRADGVDIRFDPKVIDAAYVKAVRDAGYSFHVWTVNDPKLARRAFAVGVETLTTNCAKFILEKCGDAE